MIYIDCPFTEIDQNRIEEIIQFILNFFNYNDKEISISFINDHEMQKLNFQYRNINRPTDVLSFALNEGEEFADEDMLGDIVISINTAKKQADELNHPLEIEIDNLLCHGLLHLLGYDHIEKHDRIIMFDKHRQILKAYYISLNKNKFIYDKWLPEDN